MTILRGALFGRIRFLLAVSIAVANVALFAASTSEDAPGCYTCVLREGGALGFYAECVFGDTGEMATCIEGVIECYGYPCIQGEAADVEIEVAPLQSAAPLN